MDNENEPKWPWQWSWQGLCIPIKSNSSILIYLLCFYLISSLWYLVHFFLIHCKSFISSLTPEYWKPFGHYLMIKADIYCLLVIKIEPAKLLRSRYLIKNSNFALVPNFSPLINCPLLCKCWNFNQNFATLNILKVSLVPSEKRKVSVCLLWKIITFCITLYSYNLNI